MTAPHPHPAVGLLGAAAVAAAGVAALLQPMPPQPLPRAAEPAGCALAEPGFVAGRLYGDLQLELDWQGPRLRCDGMLRPDGGLRLMFGGPVQGGELVLVVGIDGSLADLEGSERAANVTLIDQRSGQFYASGGPGRCWTRVLGADPGADGSYRLTGSLYCAGALPALQAAGSVTLGDIRYAGRVVPE